MKVFCASEKPVTDELLEQRKLNKILDSDDEVEVLGSRSKVQRKVSYHTCLESMKNLPLFDQGLGEKPKKQGKRQTKRKREWRRLR